MPPRSTDPRRTGNGRAGAPDDPAVVVPLRGGGRSDGGGADPAGRRGGLSAARRYTPHARSVRETAENGRPGRGDPFRPALQVVDGTERRGARTGAGRGTGTSAGRPAGTRTAGDPAGTTDRAPGQSRGGRGRAGQPGSGQPGAGQPGAGRSGRGQARDGGRSRDGAARGAVRRPNGRIVKPRYVPVPPKPADPRRRLRLGTALALTMLTVIAGRLVQIQLMDARAYAAAGLRDRLAEVVLPAPRGTIFDRNGAPLAHSVEARYISVDPELVRDPEATADKLFAVLSKVGVTRSGLLAKVSRHKREDGAWSQFEYLARGVDATIGEEVAALELEGVGVVRDERRDVPNRDLAANVIGFTRSSDHKGLAGIEAEYDDLLKGTNGKRIFEIGEKDLAKEIPGGYNQVVPAKPGHSVELTIDRDLQYSAQYTLSQRARSVQATFAAAVIMDVHTGEVLAQASYPTYDAAEPGAAPPVDACTQIVFDPGSVHKAIVFGAALEEGVIRPDSTVVIGPTIKVGDTVYSDTHKFPPDTAVTLPGILAYSSNVGTIKVADRLGKQKLYEYQRKFGLGTATGEGLPGEAPGQLLPPEQWTGSSPGSIPIGNGVAVTALQMASVYAAIGNDGTWVQPHLVRATIDDRKHRKPALAPQTRKVLSPQHARELRTMLEAVTTVPDATGTSAAIEGYRVAGKTGTGLFVGPDGKYAKGDVASFIGMAPADDPKYVIAVVMHTPTNGTGGAVAGPAFRDMMLYTIGHYQVQQTGTKPPVFSVQP